MTWVEWFKEFREEWQKVLHEELDADPGMESHIFSAYYMKDISPAKAVTRET